jgi:type IV secretory pathway TraG/TraD family ATPase VirD4
MDHLPFDHEEDVFFLIDEAGTLRIPTLPLAMANLRKYRSGTLLSIQSYQILVAQYGREQAQTIRSNCYSTFVFGGAELEECQYIERLCGSYEYVNDLGQTRIRPLITASEVRTLDSRYGLLLYGNENLMKVKLKTPRRSLLSRFVAGI